MAKSDIEAGRAFVRLFLKDYLTKALAHAMQTAGDTVQAVGRSVMRQGAMVTAAWAGILGGMAGAISSFAAAGDQLDKMSARTGVAGSALAEFGFAAEQSGASIETVELGIRLMQRSIGDLNQGLKSAQDSFGRLNLTAADLQGLRPEDQFQLIADRIGAIQDPTARASVAMDLFGRSGTMLLPMLQSLGDLRQEARDLGIVPAQKEIANAAKVSDAVNRVRRTVKAMVFDIGASLAEPALAWLDSAKRIGVSIGTWVKQNGDLVRTVATIGAGLAAAGTAITALGAVMLAGGFILSKLGGALLTVTGIAGRIGGLLAAPFHLLGSAASKAAGLVKSGFTAAAAAARAALRGITTGAALFAPIVAGAAAAGAAIGRSLGQGAAQALQSFRQLRAAGVGIGPAIGISLYRGIRTAAAPITGAMAGVFGRMRAMAATTGATIGRTLRTSFSFAGAGRGLGGAAGGLIGAAGMLGAMGIGGALAPVLAMAPMVLGVLGAIGSAVAAIGSPVGLLAAAVVAGGVAWVKFSQSGQAAWQGLLAIVMPIVDTLKKTFGGVKDALMAGDWQAAGQLAIAGLKLAVFQGLAQIQDAFPKTFQSVLRTVGKVGDGIVAAWGKVTGFLTDQWNNWGKATLDTIIEVAGLIPDIWDSAVQGIANSILAASAKGGVMGKLASKLLGVDMSQEQAKAELIETQRRQVTLRTKTDTARVVEQEIKAGTDTTTGSKLNADEIAAKQRYLQELRQQIADLRAGGSGSANVGQTVDTLADARRAVADWTRATRESMAAGPEAGTGTVSAGLEKFMDALQSGLSLDEAEAEFAAALAAVPAKAADTAGAAPTAAPPGEPGPGPGGPETKAATPNLITFSAAAAAASGFGADTAQDRMVTSIRDMAQTLRELGLLVGHQTDTNAEIKQLYERYLAAMTYA